MIALEPIGFVHSPITEGRDDGWGAVVSEIVLRPELADGLTGLDTFSHAVVLYWMHEARFEAAQHLARHPRDRQDLPRLGIFAQRAKHRPNPIGLSVVRIVKIAEGRLTVQGLDAIHGTPVLDVKPHFAIFDAPADAVVPAWVAGFMADYF